jgi:hypothetical protein
MWLLDLFELPRKVKEMAATLAALKVEVDAQGLLIDGIVADSVRLKARIAALEAALAEAGDPIALQAEIDSLTATLQENNARLKALDDSVPVIPPPV